MLSPGSKLGRLATSVASVAAFAGISSTNLTAQNSGGHEKEQIITSEKELTSEEMEIVKKIFGIPYEQLKNDYIVEVPVNLGDSSNYLIHIGQTHYSGMGEDETIKNYPIIIGSQKKQYGLLKLLSVKTQLKCVYAEGESRFDLIDQLTEHEKDSTFFERFYGDQLNYFLDEYLKSKNKISIDNFEAKLKEAASFFRGDFGMSPWHQYGEKWIEFLEKLNKLREINTKSFFKTIYEEMQIELKRRGRPNLFVLGGFRVFAKEEGLKVICPTAVKPQVIANIHDRDLVHIKREREAVSLIPRGENSVMVFGSGHDFSRAILESNVINPSRLGLIKVTPKTGLGEIK